MPYVDKTCNLRGITHVSRVMKTEKLVQICNGGFLLINEETGNESATLCSTRGRGFNSFIFATTSRKCLSPWLFCPKFTKGSFPQYRRQVCNLPTHFHIILRRRVHKALSPFLLYTCMKWRLYINTDCLFLRGRYMWLFAFPL
jgi:hypothetical protein